MTINIKQKPDDTIKVSDACITLVKTVCAINSVTVSKLVESVSSATIPEEDKKSLLTFFEMLRIKESDIKIKYAE